MKPTTQTPEQFCAYLKTLSEEEILELQAQLEYKTTQLHRAGGADLVNQRTQQLIMIDKHLSDSLFNL